MLNTQFAATNKANFEALMGLTAKAFEGVEQLTVLNLQAAKGSLDQVKETGVAVLSARDAQTRLALQAGLCNPPPRRRPPMANGCTASLPTSKLTSKRPLLSKPLPRKSRSALCSRKLARTRPRVRAMASL